MKKKILCLLILILVLSSCTSTQQVSMYNWAGYEDISYKFLKNRTEEETENLISCYKDVINEANGTRNVPPPGICADYGFLLLQEGKKEQGGKMLMKEIILYPESRIFIERILKMIEE